MRYRSAGLGISGFTAALLLALPVPAQTSDASYGVEGDYLEPDEGLGEAPDEPAESGASYARLLHYEGGLSLRRAADSGLPTSEVSVNAPLVPGDEIWTGEDGRAEIQLADGSVLRLGSSARLTLMNLADYSGSIDSTTLLRLPNGSLHVRAASFDAQSRRFQVDTPSGSIFLLSEGTFRIDVTASGVTTISSYRGVAELLGEETSVIAHTGERMTASPGRLPSEARAFNTLRRDEFDMWAEGRDDALAAARSSRGPAPESLPPPVRPYATELSYYGTWQDTPEYGWVWVPSGVDDDWRPYYYGRWTYAPIGMVWVSSDPWGYAPYHYGRWHWAAGLGWFWAPGYLYSGAYVSWAVGPYYYGWCPIGFYGYPVVYASFGHHHHYPWTYVHHSHIYHHRVHGHYYSYSDVVRHRLREQARDLDRPPSLHPRYRPERVGSGIYRHAVARRGAAPRKIDPPAQNVSFREREVREFRRRTAQRPGDTAQGLSPADRGRASRLSPAGSPRKGEPPRAGAASRTITPAPRGRSQSPGGRRDGSDTGSQVSPVSGRPIAPAGRLAPGRAGTPGRAVAPAPRNGQPSRSEPGRAQARRSGTTVTPSPASQQGTGVAPRSSVPQRSRVISTRPTAPSRQPIVRGGASRARPHPQVGTGGRPSGRSPFVMVTRGRGSSAGGPKPQAVSSRPSGRAPTAARPAQQSGKGGKGSGGKKK